MLYFILLINSETCCYIWLKSIINGLVVEAVWVTRCSSKEAENQRDGGTSVYRDDNDDIQDKSRRSVSIHRHLYHYHFLIKSTDLNSKIQSFLKRLHPSLHLLQHSRLIMINRARRLNPIWKANCPNLRQVSVDCSLGRFAPNMLVYACMHACVGACMRTAVHAYTWVYYRLSELFINYCLSAFARNDRSWSTSDAVMVRSHLWPGGVDYNLTAGYSASVIILWRLGWSLRRGCRAGRKVQYHSHHVTVRYLTDVNINNDDVN